MAYGWEGKRVRLVPLELERHFVNALKWINDPQVTQWLLIGDFPMTSLAERSWFEARMKGSPDEALFAIETCEGKHVGFSGLHGINWRDGTAISGTLIGEIEEWGRGYGADSVRVRSRHAFEVLGLRMLFSEVLDGNERSMRMLRRCGYIECGRQPRKTWKRGAYRDVTQLYLERDQWSPTG
jgi:RimJ/RimL family protein N-acetyltransferase